MQILSDFNAASFNLRFSLICPPRIGIRRLVGVGIILTIRLILIKIELTMPRLLSGINFRLSRNYAESSRNFFLSKTEEMRVQAKKDSLSHMIGLTLILEVQDADQDGVSKQNDNCSDI
jgi:hypothetical protein